MVTQVNHKSRKKSDSMDVRKYIIQYSENGAIHNRQVYTFDIATYIRNWLARVNTVQIVKYEPA